MFFPSWKTPVFFKLDSFSIDPRQIPFYWAHLSYFLDRSYRFLNPSRFLGFFSIDSWQLLWFIEKLSFCLANRFSIHRGIFAIDISSTAPRQIYFYRDLVLDRSQQILRSIKLRFPYIVWVRIRFIFHFSLSTENLFSHPKHFSLTQNLLPLCSSA